MELDKYRLTNEEIILINTLLVNHCRYKEVVESIKTKIAKLVPVLEAQEARIKEIEGQVEQATKRERERIASEIQSYLSDTSLMVHDYLFKITELMQSLKEGKE